MARRGAIAALASLLLAHCASDGELRRGTERIEPAALLLFGHLSEDGATAAFETGNRIICCEPDVDHCWPCEHFEPDAAQFAPYAPAERWLVQAIAAESRPVPLKLLDTFAIPPGINLDYSICWRTAIGPGQLPARVSASGQGPELLTYPERIAAKGFRITPLFSAERNSEVFCVPENEVPGSLSAAWNGFDLRAEARYHGETPWSTEVALSVTKHGKPVPFLIWNQSEVPQVYLFTCSPDACDEVDSFRLWGLEAEGQPPRLLVQSGKSSTFRYDVSGGFFEHEQDEYWGA